MKRFFDTNVLVYCFDFLNEAKQHVAEALVTDALNHDEFVISTQVMCEFFNVTTRKFGATLPPEGAQRVLEEWALHDVVSLTPEMIVDAISLREAHRLSWWDALVVVAAQRAGAEVLYSEDLQHDRRIGALRIENPFRSAVNEPRRSFR